MTKPYFILISFGLLFHTEIILGQRSDLMIDQRIRSVDQVDGVPSMAFLKNAVGEADIVFLSEPTHGCGEVIKTRIEMVKYLHDSLGFDQLVFEGGMYDLHYGWCQYTRQAWTVSQYLDSSLMSIWSGVDEIKPLEDYLDQSIQKGDTLYLRGMDVQLFPRFAKTFATEFIRGEEDDDLMESDIVIGRMVQMYANEGIVSFRKNHRRNQPILQHDLKNYFIEQRRHPSDITWQSVMSVKLAMNGVERDFLMAENLKFWARQGKCIVWLHSGHALRDHSRKGMTQHATLGTYFSKSNQLNIQFSTLEGEARYYPTTPVFILKPAPKNTIEYRISRRVLGDGYIDLRGIPDVRFRSRMHDLRFRRKRWGRKMDLLYFVRTMHPATPE